MSAIPEAVRRQAERADQLLEQMNQQTQQTEQKDEQQEAQEVQPQEQQPKEADKQKEPDYQQAYRTLQGKYNAEVPRLNQALAEQGKQNSDLKRQIDELSAKVSELSSSPKQDSVKILEDAGYQDDALITAFKAQNEQLAELQRKNDKLQASLQELHGVKDRVARNEETQAQTAAQRFITDIAAAIPDWEAVNDNPQFHAFLSQEEGLSGYTRQDTLSRAEKSLDAATAVKIFKAFKDSLTKRKENISPNSRGSGSAPEGKRLFSREEVAQFYADLARGRIKQGPEAQAKEAEIIEAQREGRIR